MRRVHSRCSLTTTRQKWPVASVYSLAYLVQYWVHGQPIFFHVGHGSIRSETHKGLWSRKREVDFPRKDLRKRYFFDSSKKKKKLSMPHLSVRPSWRDKFSISFFFFKTTFKSFATHCGDKRKIVDEGGIGKCSSLQRKQNFLIFRGGTMYATVF